MVNYNIIFHNDMGHLMIHNFERIPRHITDFAYSKSQQYLFCATDKEGLGCMFYILKPNMKKRWTYIYNNDNVTITYDVDTEIDLRHMKDLRYCM
jgi:hypothetical protein